MFTTDKSNKFTADTVRNYEQALEPHIRGDKVIDVKKVRQIENDMNNQLRQFNKMFEVGAAWGHEDRVTGASTSTNVPPPSKYGLRKDHKDGHPVRPVCGATEAPNSRFGHLLSMIVNHYADSLEDEHECKSSEQMRAAFEEFNELDRESRKGCRVISMDVKALYPSMTWKEIVCSVKEMIMKSQMIVENVNWKEVAKFIAVKVPQEEIEKEGFLLGQSGTWPPST